MSESLEHELADVKQQIKPLRARQIKLESQLRKVHSLEFIRVNQITLADVELSRGERKPWFAYAIHFGDWMRHNGCTKRFCEWCGVLTQTSDLMAGRCVPTPGNLEDVKDEPQ